MFSHVQFVNETFQFCVGLSLGTITAMPNNQLELNFNVTDSHFYSDNRFDEIAQIIVPKT